MGVGPSLGCLEALFVKLIETSQDRHLACLPRAWQTSPMLRGLRQQLVVDHVTVWLGNSDEACQKIAVS